jgi:hypothetical protein
MRSKIFAHDSTTLSNKGTVNRQCYFFASLSDSGDVVVSGFYFVRRNSAAFLEAALQQFQALLKPRYDAANTPECDRWQGDASPLSPTHVFVDDNLAGAVVVYIVMGYTSLCACSCT